METQKASSGRLGRTARAGNFHLTHITLYNRLAWFALLSLSIVYLQHGHFLPSFNNIANMVGWKQSTVLSSLACGIASQSVMVYDLGELDWAVGNAALNVSVPGKLPSQV